MTGGVRAWRHARLIEPGHSAYPEAGSVRERRAHPGIDTAACAACGEILLPAAAAVPDRAAPTEGLVPCLTCGVTPEKCAVVFLATLGRDCCGDCRHTRPDVPKVPWEPAAPTEEAGDADRLRDLVAEFRKRDESATRVITRLRAERDALRDEVVIARRERDAALETVRRIEANGCEK